MKACIRTVRRADRRAASGCGRVRESVRCFAFCSGYFGSFSRRSAVRRAPLAKKQRCARAQNRACRARDRAHPIGVPQYCGRWRRVVGSCRRGAAHCCARRRRERDGRRECGRRVDDYVRGVLLREHQRRSTYSPTRARSAPSPYEGEGHARTAGVVSPQLRWSWACASSLMVVVRSCSRAQRITARASDASCPVVGPDFRSGCRHWSFARIRRRCSRWW